MDKAKRRLKNFDFKGEGSHIALCHKDNPAANNYQTLLFKSKGTADISEEEIRSLLDSAPDKTEVEKAKFNSEVRSALTDKLREQFAGKYEWLYLEDFSDSQIVFSSDSGMFIVDYSLSDNDEYVFAETAKGVEYKSILVENGAVKLSLDAQEKLSEGEYSLLTKALAHPETSERINSTLASILEKETKTMQEEIQKAVDVKAAEMQTQIDALQAELQKSKEALAEFEQAQKEAMLKARTEAVAKHDAEGAEALVKATEALTDEAFAILLKSLEAKTQTEDQSILMKQVSEAGSEAKTEAVSRTAEILKSLV